MLLGSDDDADTTVETASSVASFAHQVVRQFSAQQSVSAMPATL